MPSWRWRPDSSSGGWRGGHCRSDCLQGIEGQLDLGDGQVQLLARAAELPAPQPRQLNLQALDLELLCFDRTVALLEQLPEVGEFRGCASVGHERIIRATSQRARVVVVGGCAVGEHGIRLDRLDSGLRGHRRWWRIRFNAAASMSSAPINPFEKERQLGGAQ